MNIYMYSVHWRIDMYVKSLLIVFQPLHLAPIRMCFKIFEEKMRTLNADDMDPYFVQGWIQITDQVKDILLEFLTKIILV